MTQYKNIVDEARALLNSKKINNGPSIGRNFSDPEGVWFLTYPCGKIVQTHLDKRKKDVVIQESN